jgi:hypothetical protein
MIRILPINAGRRIEDDPLRSAPPRGEQWLHEVKFDGWRIQLHKHGASAAAFTEVQRPSH